MDTSHRQVVRFLAGWVACVALSSGSSRAEGIHLGRFEFYPSVVFRLGADNNLLKQAEEVGAGRLNDQFARLLVPMVLRLPFRQSQWEVVYTPGASMFRETQSLDGTTHDLGTMLNLNFSNDSQFTFAARALQDYLNTQAFDGGGEVAFSPIDYLLLTSRMEYRKSVSLRHGFRVALNYEDFSYLDKSAVLGRAFIEYNNVAATLSYLNFLNMSSTLFVDVHVSDNNQSRGVLELEETRWDGRGLAVGLEQRFDDRNSARFDVGWAQIAFRETDDKNYSGLVWNINYQRLITRAIRFDGELLRRPFQSAYDVNNFYLTDRIGVGANVRRPGSVLFFFGTASYFRNRYPEENQFSVEFNGVKREDRTVAGRLGMGIQFSDSTALQFDVGARRRDSNISNLSFSDRVIGLEFRYGFASGGDSL